MGETSQELRVSRERQHKVELEKADVERMVKQLQAANNRQLDETETMRREMMTTRETVEKKEKELRTTRSREKDTARQQASELRAIQQQLDVIQQQHKDEIHRLEESHARVIAAKEQQAASHRMLIQQIEEERAAESEEFRRCKDQAVSLSTDMLSQQEYVERAKQDAILKEAEITRLSTRLAMFERQQQQAAVRESLNNSSMSQSSECSDAHTAIPLSTSLSFPSASTQSLIGKYTSPNASTIHQAMSVEEQLERSRALLDSLRQQATDKHVQNDHKSVDASPSVAATPKDVIEV